MNPCRRMALMLLTKARVISVTAAMSRVSSLKMTRIKAMIKVKASGDMLKTR